MLFRLPKTLVYEWNTNTSMCACIVIINHQLRSEKHRTRTIIIYSYNHYYYYLIRILSIMNSENGQTHLIEDDLQSKLKGKLDWLKLKRVRNINGMSR